MPLSAFSCGCSPSKPSFLHGKPVSAATLQNGASSVLAPNSAPKRAPHLAEEKKDEQYAAAAAATEVLLDSHRRTCISRLCWRCTRRHFLQSSAAGPLLPFFPAAAATNSPSDPRVIHTTTYPLDVLNQIHPPRPDWYEEFCAMAMDQVMKSYEQEVAGYKTEIFSHLRKESQKVLELGVGTGPNFKYYAGAPGISIFGIDPNEHMEKYARVAAEAAGLPAEHFKFAQAVGEALPIEDASVDAVVGTLVLCSVKDVNMALKEVKRVLKPGGLYIFVEHVAANDRMPLRFLQNILDPLQQIIVDGCHLTRDTGTEISKAGFSDAIIKNAVLSSSYLISSHVYGIARK